MDGSTPSSNKKSEILSQQKSAFRNLKASFNEEATRSGKAHDSDKENHDSNPHSQIIFELGVSGKTKTLLTYTHDGKSKTLKLGLVTGGTNQPDIPIKRRTAADHDVATSAGYFEVGKLSDGSAVLTYTPTQPGSLLIPVEGDTRELEENKPTRTHGYESIAFPKITEDEYLAIMWFYGVAHGDEDDEYADGQTKEEIRINLVQNADDERKRLYSKYGPNIPIQMAGDLQDTLTKTDADNEGSTRYPMKDNGILKWATQNAQVKSYGFERMGKDGRYITRRSRKDGGGARGIDHLLTCDLAEKMTQQPKGSQKGGDSQDEEQTRKPNEGGGP